MLLFAAAQDKFFNILALKAKRLYYASFSGVDNLADVDDSHLLHMHCTVLHTRFSSYLVCGIASGLNARSCFTLAFLPYDIEFLSVVQKLKLVRLLDGTFPGLLDGAFLRHC